MSDAGGNNVGRQWQQLPMFMSASEIVRTHVPNDGSGRGEAPGSVWMRKLGESKDATRGGGHVLSDGNGGYRTVSLHEQIAAKGVTHPVSVQDPGTVASGEQPRLFDGHHRVATMFDVNRNALLPVHHAASMADTYKPPRPARKRR